MDKLKMCSLDGVAQNIELIGQLFPNAITEVKRGEKLEKAIDFDILRQELSDSIVEGREERYQFTWPDKKKAILAANAPINAALRPIVADSVAKDGTPGGFDSENLYIEGDNLEVLKLLRETYLGKVKMIYIDPPYNTGNDFVYEDDFSAKAADYLENSGQFDEYGQRMVTNLNTNGRFHTDWLNMIYPRLKVARDLLSDDGVIFISIDDNEQENLKKICDEIFGESNFVAQLIWAAGRKNDSKYISISHEYVLCYFRNIMYANEQKYFWRERKQGLFEIYSKYEKLKKNYSGDYKSIEIKLKEWYKSLPDEHPAKKHSHYNKVDDIGIFFAADISWPGGGGPKYTILHPITKKPVRIPSRGWSTNYDTMQEWIRSGKVHFGSDENSVPTIKSYLSDHESSVPYSVFYKDGRAASKRLATLMGGKIFENPKDEDIIKKIINFCHFDSNSLILDFFSGSATTAHAVMQLNAEDGGRRKYIMVQLPEITSENSEAYKAGYKNICEIGKERIRRAGRKIKEEAGLMAQDLDFGFRCLRLDSSNMKDVYYKPEDLGQMELDELIDNVKDDRSAEDLLFQVMLELSLELSSPIETVDIADHKVFKVNGNFLIACFEPNITEEVVTAIAKETPVYAVLRDSSLFNDSLATNFEQIFKAYSPATTTKVL